MKLLFLDFDGVLNSDYWFQSKQYRMQKDDFDPKLIDRINEIVKITGAKVIISSSWKSAYSVSELDEMLKTRGAKFKVEDKTPRTNFNMTNRGIEIESYINSLSELPESIVIIDDVNNMGTLSPYLILTDERYGITKNDVKSAIEMLNKPFRRDNVTE